MILENEHSAKISEITWLEHLESFSYVRAAEYLSRRPKFPIKTFQQKFGNGKLIGYGPIKKISSNLYQIPYYYLRPYDRDLDPNGPYSLDPAKRTARGLFPSEAVMSINQFGMSLKPWGRL